MPTFQHNLLGIGKFCDKDCTVVFDKAAVTVFAKDGSSLLQGWREPDGAKLWRFSLLPDQVSAPAWALTTPLALNAHDLPSVGALVHYLHAAAGFPVKSTWLAAIKAGIMPAGLASPMPMLPSIAQTVTKLSRDISHKSAKASAPPSPKRHPNHLNLLSQPPHPKKCTSGPNPSASSSQTTWVASRYDLAAAISTSC
jgi:hypothetical protein